MLQLQSKTIDICRISKLLAKYNIKATINNSTITLDGDISSQLLNQLCDITDIITIQNFTSEEILSDIQKTSSIYDEKIEKEKNYQIPTELPSNISPNNIIYTNIKRGQVYWCDFGNPYGCEQGGLRPAIIIQNNDINSHSNSIIVVPSSISANKKNLHFHYHSILSEKTLIDYDPKKIRTAKSAILTDQIRVIDKSRLISYIGTLKPQYLLEIQNKINFVIHSNTEIKSTVKNKKENTNVSNIKIIKQFNETQLKLLSFVDYDKLFIISQSDFSVEDKIKKILKLFGFNLKQNGVEYLLKAIEISLKNTYFNLEILSESVSKNTGVEKGKIERLIVARVKENFNSKKAPTIDFIRLINIVLAKQEVNYEENNF